MSTEQVALIPRCAECGERWLPDDEERWRAYFDTDDILIFYCPECAAEIVAARVPGPLRAAPASGAVNG